jgi:hypothetical protein
VGDLLSHQGFQGGFAAGLGLMVAFYLLSRFTKSSVPGWAIAFTSAVILVLSLQFEVEQDVLIGFGLIALCGLAIDVAQALRSKPLAYGARVLAWGAVIAAVISFTSTSNPSEEPWVDIAFPILVILIGSAVWSYRFGANANLLGPILAVTILGIWVTIPETDMFTIAVGAGLGLGLATLAPINARALATGAFALVALLAWLTIAGGETRDLSIIGGWASFGVLPIVPLLGLLSVRPNRQSVVLGVHAVYSILATRVVDIWDSIPISLIVIGALVAIAAVVLVRFGVTPSVEREEARVV